jgi:hypothetical protein
MAHSSTEVLLRVLARWAGARPATAPILFVSAADGVRGFSAVAHGRPDDGQAEDWLATFLVPIDLRAHLGRGLRMRAGEHELQLPGARTGGVAVERPSAQVIDRTVLAERRARRAELAEDSLNRRAAAAEAQAENLERQLRNLEQRLADATGERERLQDELGERERDLRRALQREYAEQRLRVESEENLLETERAKRAEIERLRDLLSTTEREAETLSDDMEQVRREAAEAVNHAHQVEHVVGRRASIEGQLQDELEALRLELATMGDELRVELAREVGALRDAMAELEARLEGAAAGEGHARSERAGASAPVEAVQSATAQQLIDDLTRAVAGLRARVPEVAEEVLGLEEVEEVEGPAAAEEAEAPEEPAAVEEPAGVEESAGVDRRTITPWLSSAIARLADSGQPRLAARLIMELLPMQAQLVAERVCYRLEIEDAWPSIVTIEDGRVEIAPVERRSSDLDPDGADPVATDFAIRGSAAALAVLAAGGASRRLRGCHVSGRRRLRRFMRELRDPVGLAEIVAAGVEVTPVALLSALSAAVDPAWTEGHNFAVRYRVQGDGGQSVRVEAAHRLALRVTAEPERFEPAEGEAREGLATVTVERGALPSLLVGLPLPSTQRPVVEGDARAATVLAAWYARVQGLSDRPS